MIESKHFHFNSRTNTMVSEASDLRWSGAPREFQVKSERTGKVRTFYKTITARDRDNDVQYWRYACREDTKLNAVVFND